MTDVLASILRYGVILCTVALVAGIALTLGSPPSGAAESLDGMLSSKFGVPTLDPSQLVKNLASGSAVGILEVGMLVLIITPLARVVASVVIFLEARDRTYVGVTLLVLGMLLLSIFVIGPYEA